MELNEATVLPSVYGVEAQPRLRRWRGHRLLGVDSSLLRLPCSPEMLATFGAVEVRNHETFCGSRVPESITPDR